MGRALLLYYRSPVICILTARQAASYSRYGIQRLIVLLLLAEHVSRPIGLPKYVVAECGAPRKGLEGQNREATYIEMCIYGGRELLL